MIEIFGVPKGMFVTIGNYKVLAQTFTLTTNDLAIRAKIGKTIKIKPEIFPGNCVAQDEPNDLNSFTKTDWDQYK